MTYPTDTHYSANFTKGELRCKCGCTPPNEIEVALCRLAASLEKLRASVGGPLQVTSGYRCPSWNEKCGGAKTSQHMQGIAADVWARGKTPGQIKALAEKITEFKNGGIGLYRGWVHVDLRNGTARWRA